MKTPLVADMLTGVGTQARSRLDSLGDQLPDAGPRGLAFEDYMVQAQREAARNPNFAQELRRALNLYHALGG